MRGAEPIAGAVAMAVLAVAVAVLVDWRTGVILLGADLLAAAALRAVLPDSRLGLLGVRSRTFDVLLLAIAGGVLIVVSASLAAGS